MLDSDLQKKQLDMMLSKNVRYFKHFDEIISKVTELPSRQSFLAYLMDLTSDVSTLNTDLISEIGDHETLAKLIVEKARVSARLPQARVSAAQLKLAIQKLGYGLVYNEVQDSLAKEYAKIYFTTIKEDLRDVLKKSIKLAYMTKELGKILNIRNSTITFFAGLHHHLGEVVLILKEPKLFADIKALRQRGIDTKTAELAVLGAELNELAKLILKKWEFSEEMMNLISKNNNPESNQIAILVRFADFVLRSIEDKNSSPEAMRGMAEDFIFALGSSMEVDKWIEEMKLAYIRFIETEYRIFKR
jgi:HD-like signal output (HDOD) protein